jgi:glyoxylase-like metal-dependent hydrolase (beta-lactamase superfamily II)
MKPMNAQEMQLQYPFGEALPELGATIEVAPGVRWLRMLLPFQLDHINLWLLRDRIDGQDGWSIVDCGITNDATRAAWETIFANELQGLPVLRVIVTHMHPDHMGLAHWLTERWGVRLWVSATDYQAARMASSGIAAIGGEATARFMASHGLTDDDAQTQIKARTNYYASMVPDLPSSYRRLLDGDTLQIGGHDWRCHVGYGHAPEHMSLHCATIGAPEAPAAPAPQGGVPGLGAARRPGGVLISGDMVLPRISTNVSVHEGEPEANPLMLYLASIKRMKALPEDTLVLPSHGRPFRGLHTRVDQLVAHHDERFADVLKACAEAPQHAANLLQVLFRRQLDLHQTTFAMGESVAHLHALWLAGKLHRRLDADGIYRFTTT